MSDTLAKKTVAAANLSLASVQANIARVAKYTDDTRKTRDWSIHLFFRVLKASEVRATHDLLRQVLMAGQGAGDDRDDRSAEADLIALCDGIPDTSETVNKPPRAGSPSKGKGKGKGKSKSLPNPREPAAEFFKWLAVITGTEISNADASNERPNPEAIAALLRSAEQIAATRSSPDIAALLGSLDDLLQQQDGAKKLLEQLLPLILTHLDAPDRLALLLDQLAALGSRLAGNPRVTIVLFGLLTEIFGHLFRNSAEAVKFVSTLGNSPAEIGSKVVVGGLPAVCLYELLRHSAVKAHAARPAVRGEDQQAEMPTSVDSGEDDAIDSLPINLAFTHSGLTALQLDETTLDSFPDVFKQGMAARAHRLGDTGPGAPENWEGELGQPSIHGYISGGFQAENARHRVDEKYWKQLREDVRAFNGRKGSRGKFLRRLFRVMFRLLGMEVLHIELGQTPYRLGGSHEDLRLEHFGFRDGISQPFVDMNLGKPAPGGGAVRRDRTWDPVARGEIFLGHPDEDGNVHMQPFNEVLRLNGTFLVFRKLEQDVVGFREFLKNQRPDDKPAQKKLAAQLMGRWQNGTPLVVSPDSPLTLNGDQDPRLNDFLFAQDDPLGRKCPLGAHVRRSNPRDIGGHDNVKRHRILRRSMAYGGPLLEGDSQGDGEEKGLLFVAVNSRIDLQFEVVQGNWINKGEFLGQVGLGRCPVTGANNGEITDAFLEADAVAPVTRIPRFVTLRGGDYFFVPSFDAMRALAKGSKFPPSKTEAARTGNSVGGRPTPELFEEERIRGFVHRILWGGERSVTVRLPDMPKGSDYPREEVYQEDCRTKNSITFVGRHRDVRRVLLDNQNDKPTAFRYSVAHYRIASRRTSRGPDLLIGTERGPETGKTRERLQSLLSDAWTQLGKNAEASCRLDRIAEECLEKALQRTAGSGRIDLVRDLATETVYRISSEIFGVPGPAWLTELAVAMQFNKQHIGQLQPDWLDTITPVPPENPGLTTLHLWSVVFLADLVGNLPLLDDLKSLARTAGSEFMTHLDDLVSKARNRRPPKAETLLDTFVAMEKSRVRPGYDTEDYYDDVIALLLELSGTIMSVVPTAWGRLIDTMLENRIDLPNLVPLLKTEHRKKEPLTGIERLIYETDRINPAFRIFLRHCETRHRIDPDLTIQKNRWVGAMAIAANFDDEAFDQPTRFSLHPYLPGPVREADNYLLFGAVDGKDGKNGRSCWGRDRLALSLLCKLVEKTSRLEGLRKLAGPKGERREVARVIIGLPARFSGIADPAGPAPGQQDCTRYKAEPAR